MSSSFPIFRNAAASLTTRSTSSLLSLTTIRTLATISTPNTSPITTTTANQSDLPFLYPSSPLDRKMSSISQQPASTNPSFGLPPSAPTPPEIYKLANKKPTPNAKYSIPLNTLRIK